jgi:hypothetical protein
MCEQCFHYALNAKLINETMRLLRRTPVIKGAMTFSLMTLSLMTPDTDCCHIFVMGVIWLHVVAPISLSGP